MADKITLSLIVSALVAAVDAEALKGAFANVNKDDLLAEATALGVEAEGTKLVIAEAIVAKANELIEAGTHEAAAVPSVQAGGQSATPIKDKVLAQQEKVAAAEEVVKKERGILKKLLGEMKNEQEPTVPFNILLKSHLKTEAALRNAE